MCAKSDQHWETHVAEMKNVPVSWKRCNICSVVVISLWISIASPSIINNHHFDDNTRRVAYHTATPCGPLQCGKLCALEGRCVSINYHMGSHTCEMVETFAAFEPDSGGWMSTSDFAFVNDILGSCTNEHSQTVVCVPLLNGGKITMSKYCPVPSAVLYGSVTLERRTIGDTVAYTCDAGYYGGGPNATCLADGQWSTVNVQCLQQYDAIRIVGGSNPHEGRVEIFHDGTWGTVCDDGWANEDAAVVCCQLGYSGGQATTHASFGQGVGSIWMDNMDCLGTECILEACPFPGWGVQDCSHGEDAGVICTG